MFDIGWGLNYILRMSKNGTEAMKTLICVMMGTLLLSGCGKQESTTYDVPKEQPTLPAPTMGSGDDMEAVRAAHASMEMSAPQSGFKSKLPEGWTEKPGSGMRMASWSIEGSSVDFYLISLSMGDVPSNVNRWRGQIGLPDASAEEIDANIQKFMAGGHEIKYTELYNEEGGKGIIAAIVDLSPKFWYFTAKGSVDELKANAADIRAFLESITFEGHDH